MCSGFLLNYQIIKVTKNENCFVAFNKIQLKSKIINFHLHCCLKLAQDNVWDFKNLCHLCTH